MKNYCKKKPEYRVFYVENDEEAISSFTMRRVPLVLVDMEMSVMDGYSATSEIRNLDNGQQIPFISLTAHAEGKYLQKCPD